MEFSTIFAVYYITELTKKLMRRWDSERELSLRRHRTRATKYNRLLHKFRHSSTWWLCVGTYVYPISWVGCTNVTDRQTTDRRTDNDIQRTWTWVHVR